jgi:hypothetical protein
MTTIEVDVVVNENREAVVQLPPEVEPGAHRLEIVVKEAPPQSRMVGYGALGLPVYDSGGMVRPSTFRREEIYGDEGR